MKVIARTSSFAFRCKEQDIRKIAETLNVKTILEGSVRKAGNRIRVTAQLIDAADGSHLWSESYDREITGVFGRAAAYRRWRDAILRAVLPDHPQYPAIRVLRERVYRLLLKTRRLYWKHIHEHGCGVHDPGLAERKLDSLSRRAHKSSNEIRDNSGSSLSTLTGTPTGSKERNSKVLRIIGA